MALAIRRWSAEWSVTISPKADGAGPGTGVTGYRVELHGELDAASRCELGAQLTSLVDRGVPIILDLTHLSFCSVAAVEEVVRVVQVAREHNVSVSIIAPTRLECLFRQVMEPVIDEKVR
ncbi:STAS domain-containing protein [Hoyosella rhizosphaerae]|uniref:STAS domain-containing protein n=1 Tax=Hoyosella rhizosphaerae TaxID=1755582 RepID=A0A916U0C2_9ACTN|nr:STAS domain-containing protein [Hoyosella rhizosphaerae]MBN4926934.1 STAS domain-containing protein [Hoyosella rhizosphaerae]GGC55367.1 hypothetical protein GCM10011410_04690 [Hoyosella rhizosphaerae]